MLAAARLGLAALGFAASLAAGFAAPAQRAAVGPPAAGPPRGDICRFQGADGQPRIIIEPGRGIAVIARSGARRWVGTAGVAGAAVLRLGRGHGPRPHLVWIGPTGIGFAALDTGTPTPLLLALPGRGGAARAAAVTRLAVAEDGTGEPVILIGSRGGGITAVVPSGRHGDIRLRAVGHWRLGGAVTAIAGSGPRARIAAAGGVWSLDLGLPAPAPIREAGRGCAG